MTVNFIYFQEGVVLYTLKEINNFVAFFKCAHICKDRAGGVRFSVRKKNIAVFIFTRKLFFYDLICNFLDY